MIWVELLQRVAMGAPQPPNNLESLGFGDGIPLFDISGKVHMVMDVPSTLKPVSSALMISP